MVIDHTMPCLPVISATPAFVFPAPGTGQIRATGIRAATIALWLAVAWTGAAEPSLWFNKGDLPELKRRVAAGPEAEVWKQTLAQAEALIDPASPQFAGPDQVTREPAVERVQVAGHFYGRRLTAWMETLGFAYQMTGDERFARHGAALLEMAARHLPVTHPHIAPGFAGARGDLMRAFAVGHDWLGEAMSPAQRELWAETAAGYLQNIVTEAQGEKVWWRPHHNFMGVALGAAGLLALELQPYRPEESAADVQACADLVAQWLEQGFDEDGAYLEGTQYGFYGLSNAIRFADALRRRRGTDLFAQPRLRQVPWFYACSLLPGERVYEARNDANYSGAADPTLLRLATAFDSGLAHWLWQQTGEGSSVFRIIWASPVPPAPPVAQSPPGQHFRGRGLCLWRTGWTADDLLLSIEAGPFYPVTHNQGDKGHFTLYGLGQRWAIDSGYGNNRQPGGRDSTLAHNCVLIDGQGQAPSGAGAGTSGQIVAFDNTATWGYACADIASAYRRNHAGSPGIELEHARRHLAFVRPSGEVPGYAAVFDDFRKDGQEHRYTWLLHVPRDMRVDLRPDGALFTPESAFPETFAGTPPDAPGRGACQWEFEVPAAGEFALWARVRAAGPTPSGSDSFFVEIDGEPRFDWHLPGKRDWTWTRIARGVAQEPLTFPLPPGKHRLRLSTREAGAEVERIVVGSPAQASAVPEGLELPAAKAQLTAPMARTTVPGDRSAPRMRLWLNAAAPLCQELGYYEQHRLFQASVTAVQPEFAAFLLPLPAGIPEPGIRVDGQAEGWHIHLRWKQRTDELVWPKKGTRQPGMQSRPGG